MFKKTKPLFSIAVAAMLIAFAPAQTHAASTKATAVLAGGCFWCMESDFDKLEGVTETVSGYAGGTIEKPTYQNYHDAGDGIVPHIEVLKITYDTTKFSYKQLLDYYFRHIDATDGGGQFCDRGPSYRPAIFAGNAEERAQAEAGIKETAKILSQKVAVDVLDKAPFWMAEDFHQDYHNKNTTKYKFYRWNCGRDQKVEKLWGKVGK